jgi:nucleotide-binding universal stress UspA family protein
MERGMRILVGTDGSERARMALAQGAALARAVDAELVLLRVLDPVADCADMTDLTLSEATEQLQARWTSELRDLAYSLEARAADAQVVVKRPTESTAETIVRVASELDAQLVAIGTRGTGVARRALIGSVATQVLQSSRWPVMLVGEHAGSTSDVLPYHVLVCTDDCAPTDSVLTGFERAMEGVSAECVSVTAVHVFERATATAEDKGRAQAAERLAAFTARLPQRFRPRPALLLDEGRDGPPAAILTLARSTGVHSIWMATEGDSWARHLFLGSIALTTVEHAHIPVVLVRA